MPESPLPYWADLLAPFRPWLSTTPFPASHTALNDAVARQGVNTTFGRPVRFIAPPDDGMGYERRVGLNGEVETRPDNLHDYFNAMIWCTFPAAKSALNARHVALLEAGQPGRRHPERDALTQFDECGAVVLARDPAAIAALRAHDWHDFFVTRRADWGRDIAVVLFGHATAEHLAQPFFGLTAKCLCLPESHLQKIDPDAGAAGDRATLARLDAWLAGEITAGALGRPQSLQPLPVLGIPGLVADNADAAYYADTRQFRPRRNASVAQAESMLAMPV